MITNNANPFVLDPRQVSAVEQMLETGALEVIINRLGFSTALEITRSQDERQDRELRAQMRAIEMLSGYIENALEQEGDE